MYRVLPASKGNILGLEISGKIDIEQEKDLIAKAEAILADHDKICLLVKVNENISATFDAVVADLKWMITNLKKLQKIAIIADSKFLGHLVEIDAKFAALAGIGEKHFTTEETAAAWAWIKDLDELGS